MLGRILDKIRRNTTANKILALLEHVGLHKVLLVILSRYYEKHPDETMKQSVKYFNAHEDDIEDIRRWLSDEKSRQVWGRMIEFRKTRNYRLHPGKELPQYFAQDIIHYGSQEVFIDCGGFDGMTSVEFISRVKKAGGGYQQIIIFEPDSSNIKLLRKNLRDSEKVRIYQKGVWNKNTSITFSAEGSPSSKIMEQGDDLDKGSHMDTIQAVAMDHVKTCRNATFIKMDLEGSEMMALKGAENIIRRNKPKLAVCIYHSDQDMVEIIKYIHQLVPEYKLYVRQHSDSCIETVLYAVM